MIPCQSCVDLAAETGMQPLKYGGKELDRENGLDWLDRSVSVVNK